MKFVLPTIIALFFVALALIRPAESLAACSPPGDYSSCDTSFFGTHIAGNLLDETGKANKARQNFAELRSQAEAANPENVNKQIQSTAIISPDLVRNPDAMADLFAAAKQYGISLTFTLEVSPEEAKEVGTLLKGELQGAGLLNSVRVEINNEPNYRPDGGNITGSQYGAILSQFVSGCDTCKVFLAALGGPPGTATNQNKQDFITDFARNYPGLFDRVAGITFNSYGATPKEAITDWLGTYQLWKDAALAVGKNLDAKVVFLTEVGPPGGDPNWPNINEFLVGVAQEFEKLKATDPRFKNFEGMTFFLWFGDGTQMVITFVDGKTQITVVKKKLVNQGANLGLPPLSNPKKTVDNLKNFPEESEEDCTKQDIAGGTGGLPLYHRPSGEEEPSFNGSAGLNFSSAVKGSHCGQTKSQPLLLEESVPFSLYESPKCKTVLWSGSFKLSDEATDKFVIPFAKELGDYWAGKGAEHTQTPGIINQIVSGVGGLFSGLRGSAMPPDSGVLKKLLSANYQDSLKCSFINYVKKKGGTSMYANFSVDGKRLTSIPCPPSVSGNNDQATNDNWRKSYGDTWAKLSLLPDEKSAGQLKFLVCQDKMYNLDVGYPNVFRLGLAANELYKVFSAKENQDAYYKEQKDENGLKKPLDKNSVLAKTTTKSSLFASLVSFVKDLPTRIKSLVSSVFAQGSDPLEAGIEIIPGTPFNYSVYIRKTASGQQQYPGTIGDVQIYIPGGTPHTQNMLGNELRWDTTNPDTASFLPRVENEDQLRQLVLLFRADTIQFAPHEIKYKGGIAPSPSPGPIACGPSQCCETGSCSTSCTICNRGQKNPSDTTVWSQGYGTNGIDIGNPQVNFTFKIPDWNPPDPLPPGCRLVPCAPNNIKCIQNADYCTSAGVCGNIVCLKTNTRTVDVFNRVPFLASVWKQAAGTGTGFLNIFKSKDITGSGLNQSITGCVSDTTSVIDSSGTFITNPAYSEVTYKFNQTSATGDITVSQSSPGQGQKGKITFYRLGGICDANKWVSEKLLNP